MDYVLWVLNFQERRVCIKLLIFLSKLTVQSAGTLASLVQKSNDNEDAASTLTDTLLNKCGLGVLDLGVNRICSYVPKGQSHWDVTSSNEQCNTAV